MSMILDVFTVAAVAAGALFFLAGTVGLLRFPDSLTRLHALAKADNVGLGLIVLGLLPRAGELSVGLKYLLIWLLALLAGAVVSQLISHASWRTASARSDETRVAGARHPLLRTGEGGAQRNP